MNRTGYGGNAIPKTSKPILDSLPLYSKFIKKVYILNSSEKNGIILIGHSLGAATTLALAAYHGDDLPIIGVSALGILPTKDHPAGLIEVLKADPENPRFVVESTPESVEAFMGPPTVIDQAVVTSPDMLTIFEPGIVK